MKLKMVITSSLLLFVMVSIVTLVVQEFRSGSGHAAHEHSVPDATENVSSGDSAQTDSPDSNVDIVYYFMTAHRCSYCMKIEQYTKEAVELHFADELDNNTLEWRMVAIDTPEHEHFIKEYELITKSVVLVKLRNGRQVKWKSLEDIWTLVDDKDSFVQYIAGEVQSFLEGKV